MKQKPPHPAVGIFKDNVNPEWLDYVLGETVFGPDKSTYERIK